jgi:hypothetical protein
MNLQAIATAAADQADDFLQGVNSPTEAKPVILEWLADQYPQLPPADRPKVVQALLAILDREDFFAVAGSKDSWAEEQTEGSE